MSDEAVEIVRGRLDAWANVFARNDYLALSQLYAEWPLFWGSTPVLARTRSAILDYFNALPPMAAPQVDFSELAVERLGADVLHAAMIATFSTDQAQNKVRLTQSYVRTKGVWEIAAHHASPTH